MGRAEDCTVTPDERDALAGLSEDELATLNGAMDRAAEALAATAEGRPVRLSFVADSSGTVAEVLLSNAVSRAYDVMTADNVPAETAAKMAAAAERLGKDPVASAEHFVRLRKSLRSSRALRSAHGS